MFDKSVSKQYKTSFCNNYINKFPLIIDVSRSDFSVSHSGRRDVIKHIKMNKHKEYEKSIRKLIFVVNGDLSFTRAEYFFTLYIVEHNLLPTCSDHTGPLFGIMVINRNIVVQGKKTVAIMGKIEHTSHLVLVSTLQDTLFFCCN
ncbi:hypothetical protein PR048_025110 [Dryococelus australis]|uniref:Uncharacterized protein n=1 Tax=Dryococelus australis TaxID=614101 RepID=A0ABQ9GQH7_9NEOP|nr:hypothetical protein PR048_025110 [Dryococelus australis]